MSAADSPNSTASDFVDTLPQPEWDGPRCDKCAAPAPAGQMVCRACGYYASMGTFVELDAEWEAAMDPTTGQPVAKKTVMDELSDIVPMWAVVIIVSNLAIIIGSIAGRLLLPAETIAQSWWGVAQLGGGLVLALVLHVVCFVLTASDDVDMGVFDLVVSPLKAWVKTCRTLPRRLWLVTGVSNGIVAAICAAAIVGGIPWERVWDWNI